MNPSFFVIGSEHPQRGGLPASTALRATLTGCTPFSGGAYPAGPSSPRTGNLSGSIFGQSPPGEVRSRFGGVGGTVEGAVGQVGIPCLGSPTFTPGMLRTRAEPADRAQHEAPEDHPPGLRPFMIGYLLIVTVIPHPPMVAECLTVTGLPDSIRLFATFPVR